MVLGNRHRMHSEWDYHRHCRNGTIPKDEQSYFSHAKVLEKENKEDTKE
jgi:hypothetical protein